jgi:hypothetical protein
MAIANCLRPAIVSNIKLFPEVDELLRDSFHEFGWRDTRFGSRLLDLLAVLVHAGQKENLFTFEPVISRDYVGQHLFVSVSYMRWRIRVIDRGGDEKRFRHLVHHL